MTAVLPMLLAAAAAAVWVSPARPGSVRFRALAADASAGDVATAVWPVLLVAGVALFAGPVLAVLAGLAALVVERDRRHRQRDALLAAERARALDALALLAGDLRVGRMPGDALLAAADVAAGVSSSTLRAAGAAARLGGDVAAALRADTSVVATTLHALAACWQVCSDAGSGLATAVERLAEGLRASEAQRRAVAAELAGPRATAQLLAVLPLGGIGLAGALGAHPLQVLLHTPLGLSCLLAGGTLDVLGIVWTRRLTGSALP